MARLSRAKRFFFSFAYHIIRYHNLSHQKYHKSYVRRFWRYQWGSQNPYIEKEQTTQWPKEEIQKDKHWSSKRTHKTKNRVPRTPLKIGGELRCIPNMDNAYIICIYGDTNVVGIICVHLYVLLWRLILIRNYCKERECRNETIL
jgi:LysM repeat protein